MSPTNAAKTPERLPVEQGLRIVILEDDAFDAELIQRELGKSSLHVHELLPVSDREAFHRALDQSPDLILSDYTLPAYDAREALDTARSRVPSCPFIIVSGALGDETAVGLIKRGADDYLLKDRLARLPSAIQHALDRRHAEEALRASEERYRRIVDTSLEGIWLLDVGGRITFANQRMAEMLGYTVAEMIGYTSSTFAVLKDQFWLGQRFESCRCGAKVQDDLRLRTREGDKLWAICSICPTFDDNGRFTGELLMAADITARKEAEEALRHAAFHDSLTGLVKRDLFLDRLGQAIKRSRRREELGVAVLFIDVDRFKQINDTLGHACGDQLLSAIAERLSANLRSGDSVGRLAAMHAIARLGGDEFTVLLTGLRSVFDATAVAERIQNILSEPISLEHGEVSVTVSIGIAEFSSAEQTPEQLLRDADTALYRAKAKGEGQYEVWNQQMQEDARRQFEVAQQIRHAPERDELRLWYQPIVDLESGRLVGCEGLLRWHHPERGLVSPADFIAVAEETGAIIDIGRWALWEACRQLAVWDEDPACKLPCYISVNVSPRQLSLRSFPEEVAAALDDSGVAPDRIKLEVTESAVLEGTGVVKDVLHELSELGLELYMDDFGTGYSSLSQLYELPIDVLKIDRSFTGGIDQSRKQRSIVRSIIGLAQMIGIRTIAEGIEKDSHAHWLQRNGCTHGQGFLYSAPCEASAARDQLVNGFTRRHSQKRPAS